jgi:type VI secretion system protein ImpL
MSPLVIALIGLILWIGISVGLGFLLALKGSTLYIFIGLLSIVGIIGAGFFVWWKNKQDAQSGAKPSGDPEIDGLVKEVEAKLAAAKAVAGAKIGNLPLFFVMGEPGSVKTTSMLHSALEPELVCGQVYQDTNVVPTRLANVFLAKNTLFLDTGGPLMSNAERWQRLVRRMAPGALKSVMGGAAQAPRAVVVCFDVERFLAPGGGEAITASARNLNARLGDIAQTLGINFPVYVLFTRMDRMPFFHDFVRNFANEEAFQVFGATAPLPESATQGIYAEEATRRISELFQNLCHALSDKRLTYLPRETDPEKLPGAYEFAREFRKLRAPIVQFLVDLCRPSQLRTSPFLRGFYFSGVRPVIVDDSGSLRSAREQHQPAIEAGGSATKVFKLGPGGLMAQGVQGTPQVGATRKVPQWTFLGRLFNDVLLGDKDALMASSASTKTSMAQRILLATAAVVGLVALTGFTVSYFGNRTLENDAIEAAKGMASVNATDPAALPEVAALEKLETLRGTLQTLDGYRVNGAPYSLRWGLYSGDAAYPEVKKIWCQKFNQQLLGPTVINLQNQMKRLPATPNAGDDYSANLSNLRTYLTVTAYPDKAVPEVTSPALLAAWSAGKNVDEPRQELARKQFEFYSDFLKTGGCPLPFDADAVSNSRRYLSGFSGVNSIYASMLAAANKANKPVNFNRDIKDTADFVVNNKDVQGAFTRPGFASMSGFIKNPKPFFGGETWVLCGDPAVSKDTARTTCDSRQNYDLAQLAKDLTDLYSADYIRAWQGYIKNSSVVKFKDLEDAAAKLEVLSNNTTPLMALFWLATQHTAVDNDKIKTAFQPIQEVVPPPATLVKYIYEDKNGTYIDALTKLQKGVADAAAAKADVNVANQTVSMASDARMTVKGVARRFNPDPSAQVDQISAKLLEDPITQVEKMLKGVGADELNAKGGGMCRGFNALANKFPFNPTSKVDATIDDVNKVFRPSDGLLPAFYKENLQKYLKKEGDEYKPTGEPGPIQMNPAFVRFFSEAMRFGDMMYPSNASAPSLKYTLTPVKTDVVQGFNLSIDGQKATLGASGGGKQFVWPGAGEAKIGVKVTGGTEFSAAEERGLWAVFHFFANADNQTPSGTNYVIEWFLRSGRNNETMKIEGKEVRYKFQVDVPIFSKQFFNQLRCVSNPAK